MRTEPLLSPEKLFLRTRLLFSVGLFLTFLAGSIFCAARSQAPEEGMNYAWIGGMILGLAATMALARLVMRLGRTLLRGEKLVRDVVVTQKMSKGEGRYLMLEGKFVRVDTDFFEQVQKGDAIEIHRAGGGLILGMQVQSPNSTPDA